MDKKRKIIIISLVLIGIGFIIIGSSFAYYIWRTNSTENTNVVFNAGAGFSCAADGGGNITSEDVNLVPTYLDEKHKDEYIKREVKVNPTIDDNGKKINMDLWLNINELGSGLSSSVNFKYAFTTSSASPTTGVIVSGNFNGKKAGDKIELLSSKEYSSTITETYYLWIWLDISQRTEETMNQPFDLSLGGTCGEAEILPKVYYAFLGLYNQTFKTSPYISEITKVEFVNNMDIPAGVTTFNLGTYPSKNTDVMGWLIDNGTGNGTYTLKIGAKGKIRALTLADAFNGMRNLKEISFDNLDTSETMDMSYMFGLCSSLSSLDLSVFDTAQVTTMYGMFVGCSNLTNLDLSNFDTSQVTNMGCMFGDDTAGSGLISIDLSSFDTSNVTNMSNMFTDCNSLTYIYVSELWIPVLYNDDVSGNDMFYNCSKLPNYDELMVDKSKAHYNTGGYLTYKEYIAS